MRSSRQRRCRSNGYKGVWELSYAILHEINRYDHQDKTKSASGTIPACPVSGNEPRNAAICGLTRAESSAEQTRSFSGTAMKTCFRHKLPLATATRHVRKAPSLQSFRQSAGSPGSGDYGRAEVSSVIQSLCRFVSRTHLGYS
jgi:hypothetical protein